VVAVAEQAERERVLLGEAAVLFRGVVGDAEYLDPEILELVPAVTQLVCLESSTRGVGLGVEEEQKGLALEVHTRHRGSVVGRQFEIDEWLTNWDHPVISFGVADRGRPDE
jgi:hypothetical protein